MTKIYEAFEEEAKSLNISELMGDMSSMLDSYNQEKGYTPTVHDELRVRNLMLAYKYTEKEMDRLTLLKAAVMADWDKRIQAKKKDMEGIKGLVDNYIRNVNQGKKLSLDVGTVTMKKQGHKVKLKGDAEAQAREFLNHHKLLESYLKPAPLDVTLLQNAYMHQFNQQVEQEAAKRIEKEKEEKGKITKKREKEIALAVEEEMKPGFIESLPDFFDYIPEEQKLSITMK
ncbi:hypothetical protein P4U65_15550 [Bacillus pacificus]|nr:hypothetical protein [Bacillus pacificus]